MTSFMTSLPRIWPVKGSNIMPGNEKQEYKVLMESHKSKNKVFSKIWFFWSTTGPQIMVAMATSGSLTKKKITRICCFIKKKKSHQIAANNCKWFKSYLKKCSRGALKPPLPTRIGLTLWLRTTYDGHTHNNNSAAYAAELLLYVCPFYVVRSQSVNLTGEEINRFFNYLQSTAGGVVPVIGGLVIAVIPIKLTPLLLSFNRQSSS